MMMMKSSNMRRHMELQGPRPSPLAVSKSSKKMMTKKKLPNSCVNNQTCDHAGPVIVYLISPKIIHVQPEEFMGLVQRLTGNNNNNNNQQGVGPSSNVINASHQSFSSASCSSNLEGDFSETQIQPYRFENRAEYGDDQVPFGLPSSAATPNFAEICKLATYCLHN